jgi:hypothetical protein
MVTMWTAWQRYLARRRTGAVPDGTPEPAERPLARNQVGPYRPLYEYLEHRYATTVVLTFAQIEDLLGFTLPPPARSTQHWWADADVSAGGERSSDAWTQARRTARPNLSAQTVVFERLA